MRDQGHITKVYRSTQGRQLLDNKNPKPSVSSEAVHQLSEEPIKVECSLFPVATRQ